MYTQSEQKTTIKFEQPAKIIQRIQIVQQQLPNILEDFQKYFILYNKDSSYPEYQTMFENTKQLLNGINSTVFMISNEVESNIDKINDEFIKANISIVKEKKINKELKKRLGIIEQNGNSSDEMLEDFSDIYEMGYLRNWGLMLSIVIAGVCISKAYTPQTVTPST